MASISSVGIGSGVLTSDLIDKLANVEREPVEKRLTANEQDVTAQLSEVAKLKSAISDLRLSARLLSNPDAVKSNTVTSSKTGISGTATEKAATGQYTIDVTNLATTHSLATGAFADKSTTAVGTGSLGITIGGVTRNITIDATNNTLEGIASAINADSNLKATASVIYSGTGYQLVLTADESGTANEISLSVIDNDGTSGDDAGLSQLLSGSKAFTEVVEAEDLTFTINGVSVTRGSNTVNDVLSGVTFDFTEETDGAVATVKIERDLETVAGRVEDLVEKYNALQSLIAEGTKYDPSTGEAGILLGESSVRTIGQQTRGVIYGIVKGLESAGVRSLAEIGITTNKETGQLEFDATTFKNQLKSYPDDVTALFADQGRTSDSQVTFQKAGVKTKVGTYDIVVSQAATQGYYAGNVALGGTITIDDDNRTFALLIDGKASNTINLTNGSYTPEQLVTELQAQIDADEALQGAGKTVTVSLDSSNQLVFTSGSYGSSSRVVFTSVDDNTAAQLGFAAGNGTAGLDVAGTINGAAATGNGRFLSAALGDDSEGLVVEVVGSATGSRGTVSYIEGVAEQLVDLATSFIGFEGILSSYESRLNAQLLKIDEERSAMEERITSLTERLQKQFTAADILVAQFNNTSEFLNNQLAALNPGNKSK